MLRSGVRFDAVYFDQQVRDAIQFDLAGFSGYLQETGISSSRGIELSGTAPLTDKLALSANYTWNDTERPDGSPRPRRPRHLLNAGLTYAAIPERLNMHAFYRAARSTVDDSFTGKRVALDDYGVLGVSATWQAATRLQLYARVENLLGEDYAELAGYRAAGRAAYMGVRYGL
jgi:vitamin B12 transporter